MTGRATRKSILGWMMYDWAAQPYNTLLLTFIFAPYFTSAVVGDPVRGQALWGYMTGGVGICLALLGPVLGAVADTTGPRKPWIAVFSVAYVAGAFGLWWAVPGMEGVAPILLAFALGFMGMEFSQIFVNAMLPELGPRRELGRISGSGWALGYVGGVVSLALVLLLLAENDQGTTLLGHAPLFGLDPETRQGTRSVGPVTALWYLVFMVPFILWVPDAPRKLRVRGAAWAGLRELGRTLRALPGNVSLAAYLGSSMFYRDALNGIYFFGGIYAAGVLGWSITQIGIFGIVAAISGAVFTWAGGFGDRAFGPKVMIVGSVLVLICVCIVVVGTGRDAVFGRALAAGSALPDNLFMLCGAIIGAAGGTLQAASRTMVVYQANPARMTEAFGLYALSGRATAFLAPFSIAVVTDITQNQRLGITPVIVLFLVGLFMLVWVKPSGNQQ